MTDDEATGQGGTPSLFIPLVLLITGGIAYGSVFSANRIAFEAGMPFIAYSFWQTVLAGLGLLAVSVPLRALPPVSAAHFRQYGVTAMAGFCIPLLALTFVAGKLPPGVISLTLTLTPSFTYLFALALRLEKWRLASIGGILFGLAQRRPQGAGHGVQRFGSIQGHRREAVVAFDENEGFSHRVLQDFGRLGPQLGAPPAWRLPALRRERTVSLVSGRRSP